MLPKTARAARQKILTKITTTPIVMAGSILLIFLMGVSIYVTASRIESESNIREVQLIQNGLNIEIARVNGGVESQTLWDDAVLHLDNKLDAKWAKQYLTEYLWANGGYNLIFVLNGSNKPNYATLDRQSIDPLQFEDLRGQLTSVIETVRAKEARRGPLNKGDPRVPTPIRDHAIVRLGSALFITTADLIQPDNSIGAAPSRRGAILVAGQRIDKEFLSKIEQQYLIDFGPIQTVSTGLPFAIVPLKRLSSLQSLRINEEKMNAYVAMQEPNFGFYYRECTAAAERMIRI